MHTFENMCIVFLVQNLHHSASTPACSSGVQLRFSTNKAYSTVSPPESRQHFSHEGITITCSRVGDRPLRTWNINRANRLMWFVVHMFAPIDSFL